MNHDLDVDTAPEHRCGRCGGTVVLSASVPVRVERADGQHVTSSRRASLCPTCDRDNPHAAGVLAFFAVRERITAETLNEAAPVLREWAEHLAAHPPEYTDDDLDDDIRRWESGDI